MYRPARGGGSCEHFGGYRTINRIPLKIAFARELAPKQSGSFGLYRHEWVEAYRLVGDDFD